jgi:tetratricopeptide (TPR) repeat protein
MSLSNLAEFYSSQGKPDQAEPLFIRSLAVREKGLPPDHPDVAQSLSCLAKQYCSQGKYADAEPLYKRSLEIYEKAFGPEHPNAAAVSESLADIQEKIISMKKDGEPDKQAPDIRNKEAT